MTAVAKLLPCPFCGEPGEFAGCEQDGHYVRCSGRGCYGEVGENYDGCAMPSHMFSSQEDAAAAWNRRAALSPAELGGVEWGSHRDQLAELLLIDPESGKRCFIVSPLRSGPGGFQSFDIQSGPNAPKWCIEVRTSESGVTVPPASGCDREGQHVGACLDTSVELPRQVNPADAPSIACQLCWGDLWMKDGAPCPSCNRTGRRGHAHSTPRAAEAVSVADIGLCNWAAHILSDSERFNTRANDASAAIRRLVSALVPPSAKGECR